MSDRHGESAAAELARLGREIDLLAGRAEAARQAWVAADAILRATLRRRDEVAMRLRPPVAAQGPAEAGAEAPLTLPPWPQSPPAPSGVSPRPTVPAPEASARTVQNVLFILGGLLLGTAAVVFAVVAWATFGQNGRALILAAVTVLALAAPLVALRRNLTATAETFTGVGLLLVLLDGYAAWYVNLFEVTSLGAWRYAAGVCAATALLAAGYRGATGLVGPAFAALAIAQPVLPLLAVEWHPSAAGWAAIAACVAALNLGAIRLGRAGGAATLAVRATAWTFFAAALAFAAGAALTGELVAASATQAAWAGAATVLVGLVLVGGAAQSGSPTWHALAGCALVLAIAAAAARYVATARPQQALVLVAAVAAAVAVAVRTAANPAWATLAAGAKPRASATFGPGLRAGALVTAAALGLTTAAMALVAAIESASDALPLWSADLHREPAFTAQLLAALGLALLALAAAWPWTGAARLGLAGATATLAVLALPGSVALAWWAPPVVEVTAAGVLAVAAAQTRRGPRWVYATGAAVLTTHASVASLARAELTAVVLGGIAAIGVTAGWATGRGPARPAGAGPGGDDSSGDDSSGDDSGGGRAGAHRAVPVAGWALSIGLVAIPPAVGSWLVAVAMSPPWVARLTTASVVVGMLAITATRRWRPGLIHSAGAAALISATLWPVVAALGGVESTAIYAGVGLVAIAATLLARGQAGARSAAAVGGVAAVPAGALLGLGVLPAIAAVVLVPYTWISAVWSGPPRGLGLNPPGLLDGASLAVSPPAAVALGLLALASATAGYAVTGRLSAAAGGLAVGGPTAILVALAAAGTQWPALPVATLALGLILVVAAALAPIGRWRTAILLAQALAYLGAGLAGALTVRWLTLAALGTTVVAAAIIAAAGRSIGWRIGGCVGAVAAAVATGAAAGLAAELRPHVTAFSILTAAAIALGAGTVLDGAGRARRVLDGAGRARRVLDGAGRESVATQAAAHGGAVVALMFTAGQARHAAAVCALWGLVTGVRALWPGTSAAGRRALAAAAAASELLGWWLLLAARAVALVEAYTLPLAAVALLAGWAAIRARPELRSWVAYGPALCAGFLPSLASILPVAGEPWRRWLLFAGAITVVLLGSWRRLQAPVVVGGVVLALVAVHEVALVWDLVPRWIPLAIGGLLLLGLAITYERRRRDLARLRRAVGHMR